MRQINITSFYELLKFGENMTEKFYNSLHDIFVDVDKFSGVIYPGDCAMELEDYRDSLSENEILVYEIIVAFGKHHNVNEFYIEPKNW